MNTNIHGGGGGVIMRGPVSSSTWNINSNIFGQQLQVGSSAANNAQQLVSGLNVTNNINVNPISIIANKSTISRGPVISNNMVGAGAVTLTMASSSIDYSTNIGATTIINSFANAGAAASSVNNSLQVNSNLFGNITINVSGSDAGGPTNPRLIQANLLYGAQFADANNGANLSLNGSGSSLLSTFVIGAGLGVTGSNGIDTNTGNLVTGAGSAFIGRWNAQDGNRARTAETVFAVGTGTSNSAQKTGFLIDSGSNTFVEGTLNVSGSSSLTGSVVVTGNQTLQSYTILSNVSASLNFADDTAAIAGAIVTGKQIGRAHV